MEKKHKVSYAASMANAELTTKQEEELKELVKDLDVISCRETYSAKKVERLRGRKVWCVVDPVLLLDKDDYIPLLENTKNKKRYVLLYMPIQYNVKIVIQVRQYAKKHGLKIIEISEYPFDRILHKTIRDASVGEFLGLIKNAEVVFSNSFHAVCFSIIFKKDFYVFSRRTGRKIEDICTRLDLNDRFIKKY